TFWKNYKKSPKLATDTFFNRSKANNYIKTREIAKNIAFAYESDYGELEITINLSKPEKNPKEIALQAKAKKSVNYPSNFLVVENEGFKGHLTHPGRSNHRIIRMDLAGDPWGFQYSPYAYYNEHSIFLSIEHRPMNVGPEAIRNLLEIISQFPHYFVGSNAGLPIVGGSILSHDHYQGGNYDFPIQEAAYTYKFSFEEFTEVEAGIVEWPMSVIRLRSRNRDQIAKAADKVMAQWREYKDESVGIYPYSGDEPHNAVTPIARRQGEEYELDIVLRNNRTSKQYPEGIFHPHPKVHHIKKENIGLIEVMGLAVLPARLKEELAEVEKYLLDEVDSVAVIHQEWAEEIKRNEKTINQKNVKNIVEKAVGEVFQEVLEDAGVFKRTSEGQSSFKRFVEDQLAE
ncbi:MAG: UDP-glucose--hexose-1-phosphate uridylyltransferase, partial [Atopostipes suicloacalis]|nr:UDP-glucose--hexose-1-phosphate uridylyltransferase [Atopostipes suicloacalis]